MILFVCLLYWLDYYSDFKNRYTYQLLSNKTPEIGRLGWPEVKQHLRSFNTRAPHTPSMHQHPTHPHTFLNRIK